MKPLVSIIMPSYNCEKFIGEAIESVLQQTYDNWELIIIEDASEDNSLEIIYTYHDKRIKLFCNGTNNGIAESTNRGIEKSKGKYIALLDGDDLAEKERLSLQVEYLEEHSEIDILGGRTIFIDGEGRIIDYSNAPRNNPKYIKAMLLFNCLDFLNSTAMIRKKFIEENHLFYRDKCYGMQDFRFYIESSKVGNISSLNRFLLKHRLHQKSETNRNFSDFRSERKRKYAQFQRYSLKESGFLLDEEDLLVLNKVLNEQDRRCDSVQELKSIYNIFCDLLCQGKKMKIDYLEELEYVCKAKIAELLTKLDIFGN